ncbi:CLUMA_CG020404, isoform A [Clunio marinus]|uniref:CLUMA_CG020404, isoform A n=1 Tax=Clunio marinus TaxID=568069 RepID=A0A1J1J4V2_9DIPT|nr:CLUMA_CG020404, isoform A [Clunio marinus]
MQTHIETRYGKRTTDLKFERDAMVVLRKIILSTPHMSAVNHLSETYVGSSDSGISRAAGPSPIIMPIQNIPVFELTEELTPKRPLRSEAEKDKRLSRTQSLVTTSMCLLPKLTMLRCLVKVTIANSKITTTNSQTSEENLVPPPLPIKHRDSEYVNVHEDSKFTKINHSWSHLICPEKV